MINLLPQKERDVIYSKQVEKLINVLGMTILIGLVCLVLILLSVKLYISGQTSLQKFELEGAQKIIQSPNSLNLQNTVLKYNDALSRASSFYVDQVYMSQILDILSGITRPEGLYFTGISLDATQKNKESVGIIVSGISDTRDGLTIFKKNIEEEKKIGAAYFPPESWVKSQNINFNVTLEILKKEVGNDNISDE